MATRQYKTLKRGTEHMDVHFFNGKSSDYSKNGWSKSSHSMNYGSDPDGGSIGNFNGDTIWTTDYDSCAKANFGSIGKKHYGTWELGLDEGMWLPATEIKTFKFIFKCNVDHNKSQGMVHYHLGFKNKSNNYKWYGPTSWLGRTGLNKNYNASFDVSSRHSDLGGYKLCGMVLHTNCASKGTGTASGVWCKVWNAQLTLVGSTSQRLLIPKYRNISESHGLSNGAIEYAKA